MYKENEDLDEMKSITPIHVKSENELSVEMFSFNFSIEFIEQECTKIHNHFINGQFDSISQILSELIEIFDSSESKFKHLKIDFSEINQIYLQFQIPVVLEQLLVTTYQPIAIKFISSSLNMSLSTLESLHILFSKLWDIFIECEDEDLTILCIDIITKSINSEFPIDNFPLEDFCAKISDTPQISHRILDFYLKLTQTFPNNLKLADFVLPSIMDVKDYLSTPATFEILHIIYKNFENLRQILRNAYFLPIFQVIDQRQPLAYNAFHFMASVIDQTTHEEISESIRLDDILGLTNDSDEATIEVLDFLITWFDDYLNEIGESEELECILRGTIDSSSIPLVMSGIKLLLMRSTLTHTSFWIFTDLCTNISKMMDIDSAEFQNNFLGLFDISLDSVNNENIQFVRECVNFDEVMEQFEESDQIFSENQELYSVILENMTKFINEAIHI
ncbi:hypothetical protein TVAG_063630 [Trichomonas vaginalis G3]|uniref:Uncharacterized protein n=1 Tax=Trichomonas vaginalis (strain ATCC PRA-98 / G3) TaxID=412133 RepID=A2EU33_TRIV3|nr:hypothetical protein TVAGG3_0954970 [Trichomonas vaginalis G3]EAY03850.1 hypothetical protein TVAG_063630 [Trichomonas vaginalis G3]KAI5487484.1 hypothetical protein TVAGG3_0954970 [Trichomonas vaginalis G3]|eukprot:XP_001316073.1 hypothetical protein [Trichomonas vaginalis G3]